MAPASRPVHSAGLRNLLLSKDETIKVPATCPYCEKHFPNLKDHIFLKESEKNTQCINCDLVLPNENCVVEHNKIVHGESVEIIMLCDVCNIEFCSDKSWKFHKLMCHDEGNTSNPIQVSQTTGKVIHPSTKISPNNAPHPKQLSTCKFCSKKVVNSLLMKHIKISHPKEMSEDVAKIRQKKEIQRQNEIIEISDQSPGNVKIPGARNSPGMGVSCRYCDKTFANEITRLRHFKMEHANKAAINPHIPAKKTENRGGKVSKNSNVSRKQSPKGYPCTSCKKKFGTLADLTKHLKESHSNAKDSNAIIANAMSKFPGISISRTINPTNAVRNTASIAAAISKLPGITVVKSNENSKFAKIPDGGRVTISKNSEKSNPSKTYKTKINQKQNSKELFACVFCDKQFNSEKARLSHSETVHFINGTTKSSNSQTPNSQSKKEEFGCDVCKKNFSTKRYLMTHLKVAHTDSVVQSRKAMPFDGKMKQTKNYQNNDLTCRFCKRRFNKPNNLDIHLRYQHRDDMLREQNEKQKMDQDGMIKCSFCDKVFPKKGIDLYRHNLTEHKDAMEKSNQTKPQGKNFTLKRDLLPVG